MQETDAQIPVLILIDAEPDGFFLDRTKALPWNGIEAGFGVVRDLRRNAEQALGRPAHFTWMVRCDAQIAQVYGDAGWSFRTYRTAFAELEAAGDDVGIHIHGYHWSDALDNWVEDYGDPQWIEECLELGLNAFQHTMGRAPRTSSTGYSWTSQRFVARCEAAGIRHELSVVAGRKPKGFPNAKGAYAGALPDYSAVQAQPYRPSLDNYLVPDPSRTEGMWVIPHVSALAPTPRVTWKRRLKQLLGRAPAAAAPQVNKLFLRTKLNQNAPMIEKALHQPAPYLTLSVRSHEFANPASVAEMRGTLEYLLAHPLAARFVFATPAELLASRGETT